MDIFNNILNPDSTNDKDTLLNRLDSQGRQFNSMQKEKEKDASVYLGMQKTSALGGVIKESFESMRDIDTEVQQYQRQISQMGRAHNQMMQETSDLIKFINNPKYRGQIVTIQEVSKSGKALVTSGKPITGYVNSSSVFLPADSSQAKSKTILKVTFELPELAGRKTVPTKEGDPILYIAKNASTGVPLFLYSGGNQHNIRNLLAGQTTGDLSPNIGKNNLDGSSTNLFVTKAIDTLDVEYKGCVDVPSGGNWVKASGNSNNWSYDTCKTLADAHGSKQFALGAESWRLNVIHAGSQNMDYSGTYVCGPDYSDDRIAYRAIEYKGKNTNLRLMLYPDLSNYFDVNGLPLPYLAASTPKPTPSGPVLSNVVNCWPTFLHPQKLNYYLTYIISEKIWLLIKDESCDTGDAPDQKIFMSTAACIKKGGIPSRTKGCNAWSGKYKDNCAGGAINIITIKKVPSPKGVGNGFATRGGATAGQWGGAGKGSTLIFGTDCATIYQMAKAEGLSGGQPITSAPKDIQAEAKALGGFIYFLKGTWNQKSTNSASIDWANNCSWDVDESGSNPLNNYDAPVSSIIATKNTQNPLGKWEGAEDIMVLLSMSCWASSGEGPALTSNNDIIVAGQFDGNNSILFDIPNDSNGLIVGVDGLLYSKPYIVIGADSMINDKSIHKNTDSVINGGFGGSNMSKYYSKIGKQQSSNLCAYHPTLQEDGYPVLKNINLGFNQSDLQAAYGHDAEVEFKHAFVGNYIKPQLPFTSCLGSGVNLDAVNQSCGDYEPGRQCHHVATADLGLDAEALVKYTEEVAKTEAEDVAAWLSNIFSKNKKAIKPPPPFKPPDAHQNLLCYQNWNDSPGSQRWIQMGGGGGDTTAAGSTYKSLENQQFSTAWPQLPLKCPNHIADSTGLINENISQSIRYDGEQTSYGKFTYSDKNSPDKGGVYSVGDQLNSVCSGGNIAMNGTFNCGNYENKVGTTNVTGSNVTMICPGEEVCQIYLYLSNFGELIMAKGDYKKGPPSSILWKTEKIGVKTGVAVPNPAWKSAENAFKINGEPVPYIPGNGILEKGQFLLSENGVFRLTYGTPLKGSPAVIESDIWSVNFLARFNILDIPHAKKLETTSNSGGGMAGGSETTCDSCAVIEYSVQSCKDLKYTLKFDDKTGRYILPADKQTHKYAISGSEVALYDNPQANNTGLYKTFYIDEYNVPFVLNPDALSYDRSGDYIFFGNYSLGLLGNPNILPGIGKITMGKSPADTEKTALEYMKKTECTQGLPICDIKAFNLDISTGEVWIYTQLDASSELHPPEITMRPGLRLYLKKPIRKIDSLGEDCSDMIFAGGTQDIVGQAGGPWTDASLAQQTNLPAKCNLPRNLSGIQQQFYNTYKQGAQATGQKIAGNIPNLELTRNTIAKGLSSSREDIDNSMADYEKIYKKVLEMVSGGTLGGQLETAQLKLVEDNYQYIIWSVLAIALVMFAMSLQKK